MPPVIEAIRAGGPFRHPRNDGVTFGNRERLLPLEQRGYYREYTVPTPGASTRGARRIITGGGAARSPLHWYYTADHYESFCEIPRP
nr:ribonuclease domain-containing protein [Arsenicicoccus bolidensis]